MIPNPLFLVLECVFDDDTESTMFLVSVCVPPVILFETPMLLSSHKIHDMITCVYVCHD